MSERCRCRLLSRQKNKSDNLPGQDAMESNYPDLLGQLQQLAQRQEADQSGESAAEQRQSRPRVRVIANLPFSITSELLKLLLPLGDQVSHLYLLLEVCCPHAADWACFSVRLDGPGHTLALSVRASLLLALKADSCLCYPAAWSIHW